MFIEQLVLQAEQKAARLLIIALAILHAALAITFKVLFFSYYVVKAIGGDDPLAVTEPVATMSATSTVLAMATASS